MKLYVDTIQRAGKMRAHTATHLLHSELTSLFPQTKQAGSLVDSDYLRFDFYADRLLDTQEIKTIEQSINDIIARACPVQIKEMSLNDATARWAKAFFEDKYGEIVRTVTVWLVDQQGNTIDEQYSFELCGWTHVTNTREIGWFVITDQQAVASGIKRITAFTWPKLIEYIHQQTDQLTALADHLQCSIGQLNERVSKVLSEYKHTSSLVESFKHSTIQSQLTWWGEFTFDEKLISIKDIQLYLKQGTIKDTLIVTVGSWFIVSDPSWKAKEIMKEKGWTGWGSDTICQGKIH